MLAVLAVAALVASFITSPMVDRAQDRTDPTMSVPSAPAELRKQSASRADLRPALKPISEASVSPSPSPSPSASPTQSPSPTPTPAPETPTPSPSPTSAEPEPEPVKTPEFGEVIGDMWTTNPVNVRDGPGTTFGVVTSLAPGREVDVTNVVVDERWQQVRVGERVGFISNKYLTDEEPAPEPEPEPAQAETTERSQASQEEQEAASSGVSTQSCPAAARIESGLTDRTVNVLRAICNEFPNVSSYGGYRAGGGSYHASGQAIDVMISGEAGWEIARWLRANAGELRVIEVIYAQKIWTSQRSGDGWRSMSDRGSATANHYDHVHVSVG